MNPGEGVGFDLIGQKNLGHTVEFDEGLAVGGIVHINGLGWRMFRGTREGGAGVRFLGGRCRGRGD